ncbi:MAG: fructose-bisphosphate aldolase class I [Euryarchaeota archaeon]|mgnify:FL=1|nr:fructose-bisphosphate aldolase class I [Euryarchaeota archaeon]|tara:strand:- start:2864 stop:3877 length:1014 start_codon:yes stop_codon:yes gene_type:complete
MDTDLLEETANFLVGPGRGILAADESNGTMSKRLEGVGVASSPESRNAYRANLFAMPTMSEAISGVILYDETIRQQAVDGTSIPDYLHARNVLPGIKVDTGAKPLAGHENETVTEGLDGLRERCAEYFSMGARFAKWRAVIKIGNGLPSDACISTNAHALARYAAICQEQGLVPIIEPEVLMEGNHDAARCYDVTVDALSATWDECKIQGVYLPGVLLKPNMVLPGKDHSTRIDVETCARMTVDLLHEHVPHEIPGIVFLSGGQTEVEATAHLNMMNNMGPHPFELSYSYGRALQATTLKTWADNQNDLSKSHSVFAHRCKMAHLARFGKWSEDLEA